MLWLKELPFFSWKTSQLFQSVENEFLLNRPADQDGIQSFFSVRFATSNAKEMANTLQHIFSMKKIAYQGLENGNKCISSHVLCKNGVIFEVMGALETRSDLAYGKTKVPVAKVHGISRLLKFKSNVSLLEDEILNVVGHPERNLSLIREAMRYDAVRKHFNNVKNFKGFNNLNSSNDLEYLTDLNDLNDDDHLNPSDDAHHSNNSALFHRQKTLSVINEANTASTITDFVSIHGTGVMDIVFTVMNLKRVFAKAVAAGALVIAWPELKKDKNGSVLTATLGTSFSDLRHTLVEIIDYNGLYLPSYAPVESNEPEDTGMSVNAIDHCVQNFSWNELVPSAKFYTSAFGFHKFWSIDDKDVSTVNSALRSIVLANPNNKVLMPINEPVKSRMRGQIEEFYDYYAGPGVQHIALRTDDIIGLVKVLKTRGMEFNTMSDDYYSDLRTRLQTHNVGFLESIEILQENHILADFDPNSRVQQTDGTFLCNYILQIFSKPIHDRPTFFFEIIQRHNHDGFGKGTFKGLFKSIEEQQKLRKTLVPHSLEYVP